MRVVSLEKDQPARRLNKLRGPSRVPQISHRLAGGREPIWARSGRELFYLNGKSEMVAAEVQTGATFSVGKQRVLFPATDYARPGPVPSFSVAPDDQRFLMVREGEASQQSELIVAENWLEGLRAK